MKKRLLVLVAVFMIFAVSTADASVRLKKPVIKAASVTDISFKIKWKKVKKASGYEVYSYSKERKKYVLVKKVKKNSAEISSLKPGGKYSLKVRAFRGKGSKRSVSKISKAVKKRTAKSPKITVKSPGNGKTVPILTDELESFVTGYTEGLSLKWISSEKKNYYTARDVALKFSSTVPVKTYTVKVSLNRNLKNAEVIKCGKQEAAVSDLISGKTYYWKVYQKKWGRTYSSKLGSFKTPDRPRVMKAGGVKNLRDFGGRKTEDGKRVKQGILFRSANLDEVTASGKKKLKEKLGVKTDIDLRSASEVKKEESPLGSDINYIHKSGVSYYFDNFTSDYNMNILAEEVKYFADGKNYPIIFHCKVGKDRTGVLGYTIGALLGMNERDLMIDYELSFLNDICMDGREEFCQNGMNEFREYLETFGSEDESLKIKTERMLLAHGVTQDEIERIRNILLE